MNGLFGINGLVGYIIAVVLLLSLVVIFAFLAVGIQSNEATNYYHIEKPSEIKMIDADNVKLYQLSK